ncbi:50S ribosomal protein L10, partial [Clostridia bacterium OttesenSCG-928-F22]|nr:50S ribosomal protein L10 [Clostridia bacterium OttesenSCG-928-F22]
EAKVNELVEKMQSCAGFVLYDYRGLTVEEVTNLRNNFRSAGVEYKVIKNSLLERASDKLGYEGLKQYLAGPTAVAFGLEDPVAPAKILNEYVTKIKKTELKAGVVEGKVIDANGVRALANLPSREVLLAKMLGSMNSPITGFVSVLSGTLRQLVTVLDAIKDTKEA